MSKTVQWRGGTAAAHAGFTGAPREITVVTDDYSLRVHDGSTAGGRPVGQAAGIIKGRVTVPDPLNGTFPVNGTNITVAQGSNIPGQATGDLGAFTVTVSNVSANYHATIHFNGTYPGSPPDNDWKRAQEHAYVHSRTSGGFVLQFWNTWTGTSFTPKWFSILVFD